MPLTQIYSCTPIESENDDEKDYTSIAVSAPIPMEMLDRNNRNDKTQKKTLPWEPPTIPEAGSFVNISSSFVVSNSVKKISDLPDLPDLHDIPEKEFTTKRE